MKGRRDCVARDRHAALHREQARRQRTKKVIACALPLIAVAIAIPRFMGGGSEGDEAVAPAVASPAARAAAADPVDAYRPLELKETPKRVVQEPPPATTVPVAKDGDLTVSLAFRWKSFETGERVTARIALQNHSPHMVHVPAPGEPDAGLAIVVRDSEGREVRRVVEAARDQPLPRRTLRLVSGGEVAIPVTVVAEDETPLPPGEYTAYVEFRPDPVLQRLGLPVWTAPNGPIHSDPIPLLVTPKGS